MESYKLIEKSNSMKSPLRVVGGKKWKEDCEHSVVIRKTNFQENRRLKEAQNKFINDFLEDKELANKLQLLAEALNEERSH
tara:strand:+ start:672 stop:914 length:243 start_codon:yes stop_codon:yes gene_type:complete